MLCFCCADGGFFFDVVSLFPLSFFVLYLFFFLSLSLFYYVSSFVLLLFFPPCRIIFHETYFDRFCWICFLFVLVCSECTLYY